MHTYKIEVAKREHSALSSTLRDRLMNSIAAKKHRITKEKEAVDIADGSALLLHPNQFSLNNPSSRATTTTSGLRGCARTPMIYPYQRVENARETRPTTTARLRRRGVRSTSTGPRPSGKATGWLAETWPAPSIASTSYLPTRSYH